MSVDFHYSKDFTTHRSIKSQIHTISYKSPLKLSNSSPAATKKILIIVNDGKNSDNVCTNLKTEFYKKRKAYLKLNKLPKLNSIITSANKDILNEDFIFSNENSQNPLNFIKQDSSLKQNKSPVVKNGKVNLSDLYHNDGIENNFDKKYSIGLAEKNGEVIYQYIRRNAVELKLLKKLNNIKPLSLFTKSEKQITDKKKINITPFTIDNISNNEKLNVDSPKISNLKPNYINSMKISSVNSPKISDPKSKCPNTKLKSIYQFPEILGNNIQKNDLNLQNQLKKDRLEYLSEIMRKYFKNSIGLKYGLK